MALDSDSAHRSAPSRVDDLVIYRLAENDTCQQHVEHLLPELSLTTISCQGAVAGARCIRSDDRRPVSAATTHIWCRRHSTRVLIDTCIGNNKHLTHRPDWHRKPGHAVAGLVARDRPDPGRHRLRVVHAPDMWTTLAGTPHGGDGRWVPDVPERPGIS